MIGITKKTYRRKFMSLLTENLMNDLHQLKPQTKTEELRSAYFWGNTKIVGCKGNCSGECGYGCTGACSGQCGQGCYGTCDGNCPGQCSAGCAGYCEGPCGMGCSGHAH